MEETIIMNIKRNYILWMAAWLMPIFWGACSDELAPASQTGPESASLCFAVKGSQTRLGYDYETTTFNDGETVGCVIAEVNSDGTYYLRNSAWTYRASDGMLIFQYYWGWKRTEIIHNEYYTEVSVSYGKIYSNDDEAVSQSNTMKVDKYIMRDNCRTDITSTRDESYLYSPYLEANQDKKLIFCFYYPYIDGELQTEEYNKIITNITNNKDYTSLEYPNCATSATVLPDAINNKYYEWSQITLTGEVVETSVVTDYSAFAKYGWRTYPCFVNHTQGAVTGSTYNDPRLHKSDFLWVASPEISASTQHTVNLTFLKKTATILVYSEVKLNDIYFTPSGEQTLLRGKQIDLLTGELSDYTYNAAGSVQEKNMYFNPDEHIVPCYRGEDSEDGSTEKLHFYRLVLPAQKNCRFKMHIEADFNSDGNNQVAKEINLSDDDKLTELKEGYMYSIRISKSGKTVIRINDWKDGGWAELEY